MDSSKDILEKYETIIRRLRKTWLASFPPKKQPPDTGKFLLYFWTMEGKTWNYWKTIGRGGGAAMFQKYKWTLPEEPKEKHTCYTEMCAFEPCDATNIFLKSMDKVYPGGFRMYPRQHWPCTNENRQTKLSQFGCREHVYHGFYSCCSDTRVLVTEVVPYNLLDISDS